ncbi:TPA: hypothetical protein MA058_003370 [Klebsiella pneumoniae]|nr:hypothetical protein [Klebsiella pneumoniae]
MKNISVLNVHPYFLYVYFTRDEKTFNKCRTKFTGKKPLQDLGCGCVSTDGQGKIILGVFDKSDSTLIHELSHVMVHIFEYIGMPINSDTTEAYAYLMASLYDQSKNK